MEPRLFFPSQSVVPCLNQEQGRWLALWRLTMTTQTASGSGSRAGATTENRLRRGYRRIDVCLAIQTTFQALWLVVVMATLGMTLTPRGMAQPDTGSVAG